MSKRYFCDYTGCNEGATMGVNGYDFCDHHYEFALEAYKNGENVTGLSAEHKTPKGEN